MSKRFEFYCAKFSKRLLFTFFVMLISFSCKKNKTSIKLTEKKVAKKRQDSIPLGMVLVPQGSFYQGAQEFDKMAMDHEKPRHLVVVDSFLIDITEVTNAQFAQFVEETHYITLAERPIDWEELQKQLPSGTPKPADSLLQPGSLIFRNRPDGVANLNDFSQWWEWKIGANWKHPQGPESNIKGKENHPVVHIAYEDAMAYCKWAGRELPTEAQWEYAASGGTSERIFFWGNDFSEVSKRANTYTGVFPVDNDSKDGFDNTAPVKTYIPNSFGIFDMAGNVWEWTSDWYDANYYATIKDEVLNNPTGPLKKENKIHEKVIKGGSFLCNDSYCASYRIAARMGNSLDSSSEHKGFRTVLNISKLEDVLK